ncbi:germin-like protein subfamily 1 member 7 [Quercus suber]|uniref:Germin-like protein subfamily 1 member 7 n=1 Tax=Quercus suber TaxID=58331 RepID=A0AAW0JQ68_QUESU
MASPILFFGLLAFIFIAALASDPSPLQDFCIADTNSQVWLSCFLFAMWWSVAVLLNGLACKDPTLVEANDFSSSGLHIAGNTSNPAGFSMASPILFFGLLAFIFIAALASDPSPLQDFCIADTNSQVLLNGLACKDPTLVEANDFSSSGLHIAGNTSNPAGFSVTSAQIPGLNTLGISLFRFDYAPWGVNSPHIHHRATEILTVLEVFGSKPQIPSDVLVKAFQVDNNVVNYIRSKF